MKKTLIISALLVSTTALSGENIIKDTLGFRTAASANVVELLRGQLSGVRVSSIDGNPVGGSNIHIRGINSLRTDNQPLWIVDGVMMSTDLNENLDAFWQYGERSYTAPLNPLAFLDANQIESMEVLKDVSATARYGARGANGVIIVKTRMSSSGERNFTWSSNLGWYGGFYHNHLLAFNGTYGNTSYNMSATFRGVDGSIPKNSSNYGSFKGNFETRANKVVWFGLNALMGIGKSESPTGVTYLGLPSYTLALLDPALSAGITKEQWSADYDDNTEDYRGLFSTYVRFNLARPVYLKFSAGMDLQSNTRNIWYGPQTDFGAKSESNINGGAASNLVSFLFSYNISGELNYRQYIAVDHLLHGSLYAEYLGNSNKFNTLNGINFTSYDLRGQGLLSGSYDILNHKFIRRYGHVGGYAEIGYSYKEYFGVNAIFRADWTPKYLSNELNFFPAADAYVDLHKIFLNGSNVVSSLRLEGGYGVSGREKFVPYELFGNYLSSDWFRPEEGTSTFYDGLDKLRTTEYNVFGTVGFLDDRIIVKGGWYDRSTTDKFLMYRMGAAMAEGSNVWKWGGCEKVFDRVSAVRNQGVELDLKAGIIRTDNWDWTLSANVAYNVNVVSSSNVEDFNGRVVGRDIYCTCNALGLPVSSLYGYSCDEAGNYRDITGEGRIDETDKVILGTTIPVVSGGFQSYLRFKDFTLNIMFDGAAGHDVANVNSLVRDGKIDQSGKIALSSRYVEKADYLRLSQIGLKYRVPLKSKVVKGLDVRISADNVATFTRYSGLNPDVNCFGASTLTNGLDYGSYPVARMFIAGVTLKF